MAIASAWLEILGLLVASKATGGESSQTIFDVLGGSGAIVASLAMVAIAIGTVAVNAMNDYTGSLSLQAAGLRIKRIYSAATVAVLGFLFTLVLNTGDFATNFTNFLLFISYWISPFVGVVLADWWLRRRQADANSIVDFSRLPNGTVALVALVVGFAVGIPFQNSSLGYSWGGPFNYITANYLHGADLAYYVGGAVAFLIYWFGARSGGPTRHLTRSDPAAGRGQISGRRWTTGSRPERRDVSRDLGRRRDPQPVDRLGALDQAFERGRPRRPTRHERVVRQHEQAALLHERLELERPARDDVGRAGDHARAGDPGQVVVRLPVVERPVARQLDERRGARLGRRREEIRVVGVHQPES